MINEDFTDDRIIAAKVYPASLSALYKTMDIIIMVIMAVLVGDTAVHGSVSGCCIFASFFLFFLILFFFISFDEEYCITNLYVGNYSKKRNIKKELDWKQIKYVRTTRLVIWGRYGCENCYVLYSKKFSSKLALPIYDGRPVKELIMNNNDMLYLPITPEITAVLETKGITFVDDKPLR